MFGRIQFLDVLFFLATLPFNVGECGGTQSPEEEPQRSVNAPRPAPRTLRCSAACRTLQAAAHIVSADPSGRISPGKTLKLLSDILNQLIVVSCLWEPSEVPTS